MLLGEVLTDSEIRRTVTAATDAALQRIEFDLCRGFTDVEWERAEDLLGTPLEAAIRSMPRPEAS